MKLIVFISIMTLGVFAQAQKSVQADINTICEKRVSHYPSGSREYVTALYQCKQNYGQRSNLDGTFTQKYHPHNPDFKTCKSLHPDDNLAFEKCMANAASKSATARSGKKGSTEPALATDEDVRKFTEAEAQKCVNEGNSYENSQCIKKNTAAAGVDKTCKDPNQEWSEDQKKCVNKADHSHNWASEWGELCRDCLEGNGTCSPTPAVINEQTLKTFVCTAKSVTADNSSSSASACQAELQQAIELCSSETENAKKECKDDGSSKASSALATVNSQVSQLEALQAQQNTSGANGQNMGGLRATLAAGQVGLEAMKISCVKANDTCKRTCDTAKEALNSCRGMAQTDVDQAGRTISEQIKACNKTDGAIADISNALNGLTASLMGTKNQQNCLSSGANAANCTNQDVATLCKDPYQQQNNPLCISLGGGAAKPDCAANPYATGCPARGGTAAKPTVPEANVYSEGGSSGRLPGSTFGSDPGGSSGGTSFDLGSDHSSPLADGKPVDYLPSNSGGAGYGGGAGGGSPGAGGGGGEDMGAQVTGSGHSDLELGMKGVGNAEANKYNFGSGSSGSGSGLRAGATGLGLRNGLNPGAGFKFDSSKIGGMGRGPASCGPDGITCGETNIFKKVADQARRQTPTLIGDEAP